jgi:hypothetical protein
MTAEYLVAWEAGASAQIELFSPELDPDADNSDYRLKFTPPMRKTIRPPLAPLQLGKGHLNPLIGSLNKLSGALYVRGAAGAAAGAPPKPSILEQAQEAGGLLSMLIIPNDVQMELSGEELFLEIGVDEALLEYPWELLHDGVEFLCLKHSLGRFVNVSKVGMQGMARPEPIGKKPLSVLLISVSTPQPRQLEGGKVEKYEQLPGVDKETRAIIEAITESEPDAEIRSSTARKPCGARWRRRSSSNITSCTTPGTLTLIANRRSTAVLFCMTRTWQRGISKVFARSRRCCFL